MDDNDARTAGYLARMEGIIAVYGWAIQMVAPRADAPALSPPFAYTVGLSRPQFGHPELLVFGLDPATAQVILNDLGERVRSGRRLHPGQRIGDLLQGGYEVELVAIDAAAGKRAPLSAANRLYGHGGSVDALQVMLPDPNHRLPWDPGFDPGMAARQPLLGRRAATAPQAASAEVVMELTVERPWFPYPRGDFPCDGACWLRLYQAPGWRPVLVFTEFNGDRNPGASVENAIEQVAATGWQQLLPDEADPPVFVTHFQRGRYDGQSKEPATFTVATFARIDPHRMRLGGVQWQPLAVEDLGARIGQPHAELLANWEEPATAPGEPPDVGP